MVYLRISRSSRFAIFNKRSLGRAAHRFVLAQVCLLLLFSVQSCTRNSQIDQRITLTLIDQSWVDSDSQRRLNEQLARFTSQTGIQVQVLPAPEAAVEQLATWRGLLESGAEVPDVYAVDVIWPGILADHLIDLKPSVPEQDLAAHFPELIANNVVNGKLVALPYVLNQGFLFYRADLLREYGYGGPPKTWDELETMARRIQAGERAKGNKDFWGYVWQGAPSEALTCNALEWQVSEGGGTILDEQGRVTVTNPHTIRAWDRAARWVGSISPPGVVAYKEWDAFNMWQAGNAAFMRNWTSSYTASRAPDSPTKDRFDIAPLPAGEAGIAATIGGNGYGVSRYSRHPQEATMLVRFLCGPEEQLRRSRTVAMSPTIAEVYKNAEVMAANPYYAVVLDAFNKGKARRPATTARKLYPDVSRAYFEAVHEVLSGKKRAPQAAADLEIELTRLLKAGSSHPNAGLDQKPGAGPP